MLPLLFARVFGLALISSLSAAAAASESPLPLTSGSPVPPAVPQNQPGSDGGVVTQARAASGSPTTALATLPGPAEALDTVGWLASKITAVGQFNFHTPYVYKGLYINNTRDGSDSLEVFGSFPASLAFEVVGPGTIRGWYRGAAPTVTVNAQKPYVGPYPHASNWAVIEFLLEEGTNAVRISLPASVTLDAFTFTPGIPTLEAPRVLTTLTEQSLGLGRPFTFEATASGTPPMDFLWEFRGADGVYRPSPAGAGLALIFDSLNRAEAGRYRLQVTNRVGISEPVEVLDLMVHYPVSRFAWQSAIEPTEIGPVPVAGPVFSPSGAFVAAAKRGKLAVLRATDGQLVREWATTELLALGFSPDDQQLVSFDVSGKITWRTLADGATRPSTPLGQTSSVGFAALDPAHDRFVAAAADWNEVRVGPLTDAGFQAMRVPETPGSFDFEDLTFSPDGSRVAARTLARDRTSAWIHVWDVATSLPRRSWQVANPGSGLVFSSDGRLIAGRASLDTIGAWDVVGGERLATWRDPTFAGRLSGGFRAGGNHLTLLAGDSYEIRTFSIPTQSVIDEFGISVAGSLPGSPGLAISPLGDLLAFFQPMSLSLIAIQDLLWLRLEPAAPRNGAHAFQVRAYSGVPFSVESSTNLVSWSPWTNDIALSRPNQFVPPAMSPNGRLFFRALRR